MDTDWMVAFINFLKSGSYDEIHAAHGYTDMSAKVVLIHELTRELEIIQLHHWARQPSDRPRLLAAEPIEGGETVYPAQTHFSMEDIKRHE